MCIGSARSALRNGRKPVADLHTCDVELPVELSVELLKRRNDMRRLLGDKYKDESDGIRIFLPAIHERFGGKNLLASVIAQAKEMRAAGHRTDMLFCAYVDEVEARNG